MTASVDRGRKFLHDEVLRFVRPEWSTAQQIRRRMPRYTISSPNALKALSALTQRGAVETRVNPETNESEYKLA